MEKKTENETNPLNTSEEIRKKAREELNRQLQGLLNDKPIENLTDDNIEDEVKRLMEEVDTYEKNYVPKEIDQNAFNELKKFEEEFGQDELEEQENEEEDEKDKEEINSISNSSNINEVNDEIIDTSQKKNKPIKKEKKENKVKTKFDLDFEIEDLEDIIEKDYNENINKNKKSKKDNNNITQDKEIKELLNEYEKQLNLEVEREVEKEFKPKMDPDDIKRADTLMKKDPLINEAIIQGIITKEELILFIDYYEIFSLSNNAKKFTMEHLKALDDLCLKNKKEEKENNLDEKKDKKNNIDLNDEDAINKLTTEIEKKLESSEDILNKKLYYEKLIMYKNNNNKSNIDIKKENLENILDKYKKENIEKDNNDRNVISAKSDKSNISNITNKTGFTNLTNYTNINNKNDAFDLKVNNAKNNINEEKRPVTTNSEINSFHFTTEELMSVPKYTFYKNKKEIKEIDNNKKDNNNINSNSSKINKLNNNKSKNNESNIIENENQFNKPKTPLKPLSKDRIRNNTNNSNNSFNSTLSYITGKKVIPPIKNNKNIINNNLKSKTNQRVDLFDDDGNPLNMGKFRGARKELVKLKMGGKSKMHELFINKPRNTEENEKLRQKFMDFIQTGKEDNKNYDANSLKKSIVRKKIEDAQMFNKFKK